MKNFVIGLLGILFTVNTMAATPNSLEMILNLPGANGFPDAPNVTTLDTGAIFTQKSRFNFDKGYDPQTGKVKLTALFAKEAFVPSEKREIYFLFSFSGNRKTLSSLAIIKNTQTEQMQLLYSVTAESGKNINCSAPYLFNPDTEYHIECSWGKGGLTISVNGTLLKRINYTGKLAEAERLTIGFPGYRSAMLMKLKSFSLLGDSSHPLTQAYRSQSQAPVLVLPGTKGFPVVPGVKNTPAGATFAEKGRLTFAQPFSPRFGKVEFTAAFATEPLAANSPRRIYHLLTFTAKNKTVASLAIIQYPEKEKMLLTYTVTTADGKNVSCNAQYPFAPKVEHHISVGVIQDKLTLIVNGVTLKTTPWRGKELLADRLLIGFSGSRQAMPMTLKSFKLY